jgi:hypothetical protein
MMHSRIASSRYGAAPETSLGYWRTTASNSAAPSEVSRPAEDLTIEVVVV